MVLFPQRRSVGGVPISAIEPGQPARAELLGVLGLYHTAPVELPHSVLALAGLFAEQIALTLCNLRLFRDRQHYIREAVLERTHDIVGPLAAGIAHDLNNVLGVVMGVAHLLPRLGEPAREGLLGQLALQVEHGACLTRSLLDLSRVGSTTLDEASCDLAVTARQAIEVVRTAAHPDTVIVVEAPAETVRARIEPLAFSRILLNLLLNAIEAIGIRGQQGRIAVRIAGTLDRCTADVDDNGPGVRDEIAARIFEPFASFDKPVGIGIGLASARGLAEQAGGTLALRHRPGPGACFVVELPRHPENTQTDASGVGTAEARPRASTAAGGPARTAGPGRLLLAEDEPVQRQLFASALRAAGHRVTEAATGLQAAAVVALEAFDLLILDQRMPGMTGLEVLKYTRDRGAQMPVLLVSGYGVDVRSRPCLEGARIVSKPLTGEALLSCVEELLAAGAG
jgi:signal transduction histidine kinase/CheY-like chemotaxis protein